MSTFNGLQPLMGEVLAVKRNGALLHISFRERTGVFYPDWGLEKRGVGELGAPYWTPAGQQGRRGQQASRVHTSHF